MGTRNGWGLCLAFVVLGMFGARNGTCAPQKIGVSVPLTGDAAAFGTDIRRVIEYANDRLGGGKYSLLVEDDKCSGKDAVSVAHKFVEQDKVQFVLGPVCSGAALSAAPIYEAAGLTAMTLGASSPALSSAGPHTFRMGPNDTETAAILFRYIVSQGRKLIGVASEETDYCQGLVDAFRQYQKTAAVQARYENFNPGTADYRSILLRLRRDGVDSLFFNVQAEPQAINLVKQIRALHWDVPLYAAYYPSSPTFLEGVGDLAEGISYVDVPLLEESLQADGQAAYNEFVNRYGKLASHPVFFVYAFEGFRVMHEALMSGLDPTKFIAPDRKFRGIAGEYSFNVRRDVTGMKQAIRVIRNGKPVRLE